MNLTEYTDLLNKPNIINDKKSSSLKIVLDEFPYFQSARALYLKGLYKNESITYNNNLKITAAYTTDRSVLFDFITSNSFVAVQKDLYDQKLAELMLINVIESEVVLAKNPENTLEHSIKTTIKQAKKLSETELLEEKLELGKPLDFDKNEKHSFNEWLQLAKFEPINRAKSIKHTTILDNLNEDRKKKNELIERFIETNPKIPQINKNDDLKPVSIPEQESNNYIMTETLAKVYLEQKKYLKAIQAYQILILKYPEKSSFFAARISDIEKLQQNNN